MKATPTPKRDEVEVGHVSVADMVRAIHADEPEFVESFQARLAARQLVKSLTVMRARAGLTQADMAAKLGCTQSKISKIESGVDVDLRFGEVVAYLKATEHRANISVVPGRNQWVGAVNVETPEPDGQVDPVRRKLHSAQH